MEQRTVEARGLGGKPSGMTESFEPRVGRQADLKPSIPEHFHLAKYFEGTLSQKRKLAT